MAKHRFDNMKLSNSNTTTFYQLFLNLSDYEFEDQEASELLLNSHQLIKIDEGCPYFPVIWSYETKVGDKFTFNIKNETKTLRITPEILTKLSSNDVFEVNKTLID